MDGSQRLQGERVTHHGEIPGLPDGRWLVPFLLLYVRNGDANVYELAERLSGLGFGVGTPAGLHQTLRKMEKDGLLEKHAIVPNGNLHGSGATRERYDLTVAGESYLDLWGASLEQYGEELGLFLRLYKGDQDTRTRPAKVCTDSDRAARGGAGTVFVLTSSGLRHMGLRPGQADWNGADGGFLGHPREEIFWKDAFELVHDDDLPLLWFLVALVMEEPGASESVEVRFRDAWGDWILMDVCVLNVLEAPTNYDTGLLVVNVRQAGRSASWSAEIPSGSR